MEKQGKIREETFVKRRIGRKVAFAFVSIVVIPILAIGLAFYFYTSSYYRGQEAADAAIQSDEMVHIHREKLGYFFDGKGEDSLLVFYPGAKVETKAYAPLLRQLAEGGVDVYLVDMPFRLAIFGVNRADQVLEEHAGYAHKYLGGHSLGGAMASQYAADHQKQLSGLVLLASYPTKDLREGNLSVISIYGSEDGVLNRKRLQEGEKYLPDTRSVIEMKGANHAQFGDYGRQKKDKEATISKEEQWNRTSQSILSFLGIR